MQLNDSFVLTEKIDYNIKEREINIHALDIVRHIGGEKDNYNCACI